MTWIPVDVGGPRARRPRWRPSARARSRPARDVIDAARAGDARSALAALGAFRLLCAHRRGPDGVATWIDADRELARRRPRRLRPPTASGTPAARCSSPRTTTSCSSTTATPASSSQSAPDHLTAAFERRGEVLQLGRSRLGAVDTVYAMTIHKSQGSQFDTAAVLLPDADLADPHARAALHGGDAGAEAADPGRDGGDGAGRGGAPDRAGVGVAGAPVAQEPLTRRCAPTSSDSRASMVAARGDLPGLSAFVLRRRQRRRRRPSGRAARLDHLVELGVEALWLSPFYRSPMADFGYDISDYEDVAPVFGTLADFDALLEAAHDRDLRVVLDWVPNHTSDQHPSFTGPERRGWYVWRDQPLVRPVVTRVARRRREEVVAPVGLSGRSPVGLERIAPRATRPMFTPGRAKRRTVARPMPFIARVITTVVPLVEPSLPATRASRQSGQSPHGPGAEPPPFPRNPLTARTGFGQAKPRSGWVAISGVCRLSGFPRFRGSGVAGAALNPRPPGYEDAEGVPVSSDHRYLRHVYLVVRG